MSDAAAAVIELRDTSKSYGAVQAPRDGNLSLRPGEVRALLGENGAGKSTLVKVLGGVVRRDAGDMLVDGQTVDFRSPHDARDAGIAVIYQEPTLFPDLSIAENVVMGYHPLGALRRMMHSRALSFEARVLIMDEPTAALSGPEVERLFAVVKTLREEGAAVLSRARRSSATDVNARRQAEMAEFFELPSGERPDTGLQRLEEVFHLA